jgi:hypothetical protein|tara:strand:- start:1091 stop:1474 length:384 start_codon:yes stop_codon:yes gene_type:complete
MTSEADIFEYQSKRPVSTRTGFGGLDLSAEEGQFTIIYDGWDGSPFRVRNIEVDRYLSKTKSQTIVDKDGKFKTVGEPIPAFVKSKEEAKVVSGDAKGFITPSSTNAYHKKGRRGGKRARRRNATRN